MLNMYANKQKLQGIHDQQAAQAKQQMEQDAAKGDPLLGMAGSIAGTAIGGAVGGPMGAKIGGQLGGSLAGKGDLSGVDPTSLATGMISSGIDLGSAQNAMQEAGSNLDMAGEMLDAEKGFAMADSFGSTGPQAQSMLAEDMDIIGGDSSFMADRFGEGLADASSDFATAQTNFADSAANFENKYNQFENKFGQNAMKPFMASYGFSRGGPISYAACGGKMKYRAEGSTEAERGRNAGGTPYMNRGVLAALNKEIDPFFDNPYNVGMFIDTIAYDYDRNDPDVEKMYNELQKQEELRRVKDLYENPIGIIRRENGSYEPEMSAEELARREAEMKRRMMQEEMYERNKRAHEAAGEGYYFGPLKSMQYKSAGGEVYTQNYYNPKEK